MQITTAVSLRSKLYNSICDQDTVSKNTCKGVEQNVSEKLIIDDYSNVRKNRDVGEISQNVIYSK